MPRVRRRCGRGSCRWAESAVSIELADGLGLPVLSVASMVARPVSDRQLLAAVSGSGPDRLFELIWSAQPSADAGAGIGAPGGSAGVENAAAVVFESAPVAGDVVAEVYAATRAALAVLQSWLAERPGGDAGGGDPRRDGVAGGGRHGSGGCGGVGAGAVRADRASRPDRSGRL